ncbi:MAG: hypothetical protein AB1483_08620 [Candidatus Zixiibacteriota bacterium]
MMKKLFILTFAVLLLMGTTSMATDTRVLTMGDNNTVLLDDANIWLFPSRIFEYQKIAVGEFGVNDDFTNFGVHWAFGNDNPIVFGTYFSKLAPAVPTDLLGGNLVPFDFALLDNRRIDFLYGNQVGDLTLGARISYYNSSQEFDYPADQSEEGFSYYDFDFGLTPSGGAWDLAVNVGFGSWTDKNAVGQKETEADGFMDIGVLGRYFWQRNPNYTFIPHAGFFHSKRGIIDNLYDGDPATTDDRTDKYTWTGWDLGIGTNYTPAANVLAVMDFGFMYGKWKDEVDITLPAAATGETTESYSVLPYFKIGLDADVFKWMDVRLGATSYWTSFTEEDKGANEKFKAKYAANDTYLGFGFHWNRLHVDTYTDPELFLQGFDFISGNGDTDMNFQLSVVYEMM